MTANVPNLRRVAGSGPGERWLVSHRKVDLTVHFRSHILDRAVRQCARTEPRGAIARELKGAVMSQGNDTLVRDFVDAFQHKDTGLLERFLDPDVVFRNSAHDECGGRPNLLRM